MFGNITNQKTISKNYDRHFYFFIFDGQWQITSVLFFYMYFSLFYQENTLKTMHFSYHYRHFSYIKNSILIV